jgi:pimeloyl-ACP methyl ester carboxylesterase
MRGIREKAAASGFALVVWLATSATAPAAAADGTLAERLAALGGTPCERAEGFTCVAVKVPYDHNSNDPQKFLEIEFAAHPAEAESQGVLFYAVGGPGVSGIEAAADYLGYYDERLTRSMDIVFFDQRGVGPSHGIECAGALADYDSAPLALDRPEETIAAAKNFVEACVAETGHADLLPWLDTGQAIRDLEAFRQAIGAPKVWLYGESYGTQFVQEYATAYPGAIAGVILDGVVDLTLDAEGYYGADVLAFEGVLRRTLEGCDAVPDCREDMGRPASAVYRELASKLSRGPIEVPYPLASGELAARELTPGMLQALGAGWIYGPEDRADLLRALAAASHGNLVPLMRRGYQALGLDPETLEAAPAPDWYGAAYYAITCRDYGEPGEDPAKTAAAILARARKIAPDAPLMIRTYYAERIACAFWPEPGRPDRPQPFAGGEYPTFVLNADADPATPISNGYAVFDAVKNGYMVTMQGGPHVILGRGLACPDTVVLGLMLDGTEPSARELYCEQEEVAGYVPLSDPGSARKLDPFALARGVEAELGQLPELWYWDGAEPLAVGCDFGGSVTATGTDAGTDYSFADCALWPGIAVGGTGSEVTDAESGNGMALDLTVRTDGKPRGKLAYRHDTDAETMSLEGTLDDKPVATPRPAL